MGHPIFQVDSFTEEPFRGNPAGVCLPREPKDDPWMQAVAAEMNLSETAFLQREDSEWRLRWFTPAVEVRLCGHATLASAHVLWEVELLGPGEEARFRTRSGLLTVARRDHALEMDFPSQPETEAAPPEGLRAALGVEPLYVGRSKEDYLLLLEDESAVRSIAPDFAALGGVAARGIIVTAPARRDGLDFVSRFFAPAVGVAEDPVTGSAHCTLGPFWAARLGRMQLAGWQASSRGGLVRVRVEGERVKLAGQAVTVFRGELSV